MSNTSAPGNEPGADSFGVAALAASSVLIGAVLSALVGAPSATGQSGSRALLPDLGVAPLKAPLIERTYTNQRRLRFTVSIANVGLGPMQIEGTRATTNDPFRTHQRIKRVDGSSLRVATPRVRLEFAGSERHGHWHIRGAARYELRRLSDGKPARIRTKRGFCLFDSTSHDLSLATAPKKSHYQRGWCGERAQRRLAMGISPGWKDDYYWRIPGQEMDITNLPHGRYRLFVRVDPRNWFRESNERNNTAWVDIEISDSLLVKVLGRSPRL